MAAGLWRAGSGKHLVPSRKARLLPVDNKAQLCAEARGEPAIGVSLNHGGDFVCKSCQLPAIHPRVAAQKADPFVKLGSILRRSPRRGFFDKIGAYQALGADV